MLSEPMTGFPAFSFKKAAGLLLLALAFGGAPSAMAQGDRGDCGGGGPPSRWLQQVNAARSQARVCGNQAQPPAPPLVWHTALFAAAERHALDMAENDRFSHSSRDGQTLVQRVTATGYAWRSVGENLAAGERTVDGVIAAWLASPGHCANLMSSNFSEMGLACVRRSGSTYDRYWVLVLARP